MALTPSFGSIKPSQKQQLLNDNFLSFNGGTGTGDSNSFAQQYLPEIYEQEVERYGNRTLSGFLRMVGAEMPMTSDQVIWSEQNRLHVAYNDVSNDLTNTLTFTVGGAGDTFVENVISANQTIVILDPAGLELKACVPVHRAQNARAWFECTYPDAGGSSRRAACRNLCRANPSWGPRRSRPNRRGDDS